MPRTCTVCHHGERHEIERALIGGEPLRSIARRFDTTASALSRHRKGGHLPVSVVAVHQEQEAERADDLKGELLRLKDRLDRMLDAVEREGQAHLFFRGTAEVRALVELLMKVTGQLDERPVVNLFQHPEMVQVVAVIQDEVPDPDQRARLAARLREIGP